MKVFAIDPKDVVVDQEYRTRHGEPDAKKVKEFLDSMVDRNERNLPPQILNAVVRPGEKEGKYVLVDGEHRLLALVEFNKLMKANGEDVVPLYATVEVDKDKVTTLTTSIEANLRAELDLLDKAVGMARLQEAGQTLEQIAHTYHCGVSTASDIIAVGKLPKKIQAKIESGTLTIEGAMVLARYNKDPKLQEELLTLAEQDRKAMDSIEERAAARAKAAAEPKGEKGTTEAKGKKAAPAAKKKTAKGKTTAENVKAAVAEKGVQKRKKTAEATPSTKSYRAFVKLVEDKEWQKGLPGPALDLIGVIEGWFEGDRGDQSLHNGFEKFCKSSVASKAA